MRWIWAFLVASASLPGATTYNVVALGGYGGGFSSANGIAANGLTAVTALTSGGIPVALVGGSGSGTASLLGIQAEANDVNAQGHIVGTSTASGTARATVWRGGVAEEILGMESYGLAINQTGDIAGSRVTGGRLQAFVQAGDQLIDLSVTGALWSSAYDINSSGSVAGYAMLQNGTSRAFTWSAAQGARTLGTLGGRNSYAQALNDRGDVVGASTTSSGWLHAFLYNGSMRDLGTLGGTLSSAYDINMSGQVVGYAYDAAGRSRAFLWFNGLMVDLNTLLGAESGWVLNAAYGINDAGQIVGDGTYLGEAQAFRLDPRQLASASLAFRDGESPVPEPAWMAVIGLGSLWLWTRKTRKTRQ